MGVLVSFPTSLIASGTEGTQILEKPGTAPNVLTGFFTRNYGCITTPNINSQKVWFIMSKGNNHFFLFSKKSTTTQIKKKKKKIDITQLILAKVGVVHLFHVLHLFLWFQVFHFLQNL